MKFTHTFERWRDVRMTFEIEKSWSTKNTYERNIPSAEFVGTQSINVLLANSIGEVNTIFACQLTHLPSTKIEFMPQYSYVSLIQKKKNHKNILRIVLLNWTSIGHCLRTRFFFILLIIRFNTSVLQISIKPIRILCAKKSTPWTHLQFFVLYIHIVYCYIICIDFCRNMHVLL